MLNNLVPNFTNPAFEVRISVLNRYPNRHGLLCTIPRVSNSLGSPWQLHERSFLVTGPKLFNRRPKDIREFKQPWSVSKGGWMSSYQQ